MDQEVKRIDLEGVNCYLCEAGDGFILFDTGGHLSLDKQFTNRRERLENALANAGCIPGNLRLIVLTHGDSDHSANAAYLRKKYGARIAMHPGDLKLVKEPTPENVLENFRFRSLKNRIMSLFVGKLIRKITAKTLADFESFEPDILLEEGSSLLDYGLDAVSVHLPGHTDGSIGLLLKDGTLIAGDIYTCVGKPVPAINAKDFTALDRSIGRLKGLAVKRIFPGHGEPFEYGY